MTRLKFPNTDTASIMATCIVIIVTLCAVTYFQVSKYNQCRDDGYNDTQCTSLAWGRGAIIEVVR